MALAKTFTRAVAVLAAVVDQGGFAQAAAALNRSQSAVSYAVARLQEALAVPLLAIQGRKAVLTPDGRVLLKRSRSLLADLAKLELLARSLKQGWEPELRLVVDAAFPRERLLSIVGSCSTSVRTRRCSFRMPCCQAQRMQSSMGLRTSWSQLACQQATSAIGSWT